MGQNLFSVLFSSIKSKFASLVSKLRLLLSWDFVRTRIIGRIRDFFVKLFDVRPKNKDDYYTVFRWMISKRLAYLIIIVVGVLSIWYITSSLKLFSGSSGGIPTYSYNSFMLRLADDKVRIKAKSGYIAYEGQVSKGYVTGEGKLFSRDGVVLYSGTFEKNRYEGEGTLSYESGAVRYKGNFHANLYEGQGTLFRPNGTREYEGTFFEGMKEGEGKLFDSGGNPVYEGTFASDEIIYGELLGKSPKEIREKYLGKQKLYEENEDLGSDAVIHLSDINALYLAKGDGAATDDEMKAVNVIVLSNVFRSGRLEARGIEVVKQILGEPVYEGYSSVILPEAVAINILNDRQNTLKGRIDMDTTMVYSDDVVVNSFDQQYTVYIYTFRRGDLNYSFVCNEKGGNFAFYEIQSGGDQ